MAANAIAIISGMIYNCDMYCVMRRECVEFPHIFYDIIKCHSTSSSIKICFTRRVVFLCHSAEMVAATSSHPSLCFPPFP